MAYFVVKVEEIHISHMVIEADDEQQALEIWTEGDELKLEYHRTVDDLDREVVVFDSKEYTGEEVSRSILDLPITE